MIRKIILSVIIAAGTTLGCMLLGAILSSMGIPIASTIGDFMSQWSYAIGVLVGLWWFFAGPNLWPTAPV